MAFEWSDLRKAAFEGREAGQRAYSRRRLQPWLVAGAVVFALVMCVVWVQSRVDVMTQELALEKKRQQHLRSQVALSQQQVQQFSSLREVEPRARMQLGLEFSQPGRVVELKFDATQKRDWDPLVPEAYAAGKASGSR